MVTPALKKQYDDNIMQTYSRFDYAFVSGHGATLVDEQGKEYIDFASGIGVNSVGYAHPSWVKAVAEQAGTLAHVSNLYYTKPGAALAEKLTQISSLSKVFFANSGAEANEGVIKAARKYSHDQYGDGRSLILTLKNSFHGRTVTTLAATGQDTFHTHFMPFTPGFESVPAEDISALEAYENKGVCAVFLELVQGEGGVIPLSQEYVNALTKICEKNDWLLCVDEVQTGIGRTGTWFAYQGYGILPDLVSFAKGIAGGLPFGGVLAGEKVQHTLTSGTHATTFGGNCIAAAAALATLDILSVELPLIQETNALITKTLLDAKLSTLREIRGRGLMLGLSLKGVPREYVLKALEAGVVTLTAGTDAMRLLPPLTISSGELQQGLSALIQILK